MGKLRTGLSVSIGIILADGIISPALFNSAPFDDALPGVLGVLCCIVTFPSGEADNG